MVLSLSRQLSEGKMCHQDRRGAEGNGITCGSLASTFIIRMTSMTLGLDLGLLSGVFGSLSLSGEIWSRMFLIRAIRELRIEVDLNDWFADESLAGGHQGSLKRQQQLK